MVRPRQSPAKGGAAEEGPSSSSRRAASPPPPMEERCQRNDGKGWRCRGRKFPGQSFCEVHHRQYVQRFKAGRGTNALDGSRSPAKKSRTKVSGGGGEVKGEGGGSNGRAAARVRAAEGKEEASRPGAEDMHKKSGELEEKLRNAADNGATRGILLGKREQRENSDEETLKLNKMESSPELEDKKLENPAVEKEVIPEENTDSSPVPQPANIEKDFKKRLLNGPDAIMCHQCQRNDKGRVVGRFKCKKKRYCVPCIQRCRERIDLVNALHVECASSQSVTSVAVVTREDAIPSIKDCIDALKLLPYLSRDTYIKALDLFKDAYNRSLFIVLDEKDKADWVHHHTS